MRYGMSPAQGLPTVVKNLLIINGIMFLLKVAHPFGPSADGLDAVLGLHFPGSPLFKPWQLITHMFMHGGLMHLLLNMLALFMLGPRVEYRWGSQRFLTYYLLCGLGAAVIYLGWQWYNAHDALAALTPDQLTDVRQQLLRIVNDGDTRGFRDETMNEVLLLYYSPMVGASGAIFGVLLAFGMLYPNVELMTFIGLFPIPMKAKWFVLMYGAIELFTGLQNNPLDNTAHFAHLGGMLIGFFLVRHWERRHIF
ncbi:MAG: rhomboid family intramembrane serine protease [Flavobacteriales bacterium]